ncbi:hypothetical protein [Subtercola sp. YIM 133946]|uniref:hypothetical protein n=1 Tax=Subtercola sp. YIM 133946 TaxID=3118909 RepID=UPI002F94CB2C
MRVATIPVFANAEHCGHWDHEDCDEPRALDDMAMTTNEYWATHFVAGIDGEVVLCYLSPEGTEIMAWCADLGGWEPVSDHRRYCAAPAVLGYDPTKGQNDE